MAAITNRLLHLRPTFHSYLRPYSCTRRHFSSSDRDDAPPPEPAKPQSSVSSSLNDVKASLQNSPRQPPSDSFPFSSGAQRQTPPQSPAGSLEALKSRLAEYRERSVPPPPSTAKHALWEDLYQQSKSKEDSSGFKSPPGADGGDRSFINIRKSLNSLGTGLANLERKPIGFSGSRPTDTTRLGFDSTGKLGAGAGSLISPIYQKDAKHVDFDVEKMKALRPEKRKGKWFSLQEMSNRLAKVRELEHQETEKRMAAGALPDAVKLGIVSLMKHSDMKSKQKRQQIAVTYSSAMTEALDDKNKGPPKDHLVEKYFHPDNMSSAEKLKLELAKVRDEFKMSESDCGSARVQVAQLTTKIKHLSSALHKKDKHSRRGLLAMVQRRKKLLKYLRRTDFDSYCLVLSKLGLRDNPDVKA